MQMGGSHDGNLVTLAGDLQRSLRWTATMRKLSYYSEAQSPSHSGGPGDDFLVFLLVSVKKKLEGARVGVLRLVS